MTTQNIEEQVRWQDLKVRSELDIVLEIAEKEGWDDCEVFGCGDMITQPQESNGWKLIPADLYKYSIPKEALGRLHQIINAGVRVQGVIIADDERRTEPSPAPTKPKFSLPSVKPIMSWIGNVRSGLIHSFQAVMSFSGKALLQLIRVVCVIAIVSFVAMVLIYALPVAILVLLISAIAGAGTGVDYDPKLVILVDDGRGGTVWVSLFTWYD